MKCDLFGPPVYVPEGVCWDERYRKWRAHIIVDGKEITLGRIILRVPSVLERALKRAIMESG